MNVEKIYWELYFALKEEIINDLKDELGITQSKDADKLITFQEALEFYKISSSTLHRYIRDGLQCHSKGKHCKKLFTIRQINNFLLAKKKCKHVR